MAPGRVPDVAHLATHTPRRSFTRGGGQAEAGFCRRCPVPSPVSRSAHAPRLRPSFGSLCRVPTPGLSSPSSGASEAQRRERGARQSEAVPEGIEAIQISKRQSPPKTQRNPSHNFQLCRDDVLTDTRATDNNLADNSTPSAQRERSRVTASLRSPFQKCPAGFGASACGPNVTRAPWTGIKRGRRAPAIREGANPSHSADNTAHHSQLHRARRIRNPP